MLSSPHWIGAAALLVFATLAVGWALSGKRRARGGPSLNGDHVLLNCPFDRTRQDLVYIGPHNEVWHAWWTGGMSAMWDGTGQRENLGGRIKVGTLSAQWTTGGDALCIVGLGEPVSDQVPVDHGQYWGCTIDRSGKRSGWGSIEHVYGSFE